MLFNNIDNLMIGSTPQDRAYLGDVLIWPQQPVPPSPYENEYLTIRSLEDGNRLKFNINITYPEAEYISYSRDKVNWTTINITGDTHSTITVQLDSGETVYWKGVADIWCQVGEGTWYASNFYSEKRIEVEGNVMSLLYGDDFIGKYTIEEPYAFYGLFALSKLVNAQNLILPATSLSKGCYRSMFCDCDYLVNAPDLPATVLSEECYYDMFHRCTSLVNAPELPATDLAEYCYGYMFQGCASLVNAPELPSTDLVKSCYGGMFIICTSLVDAPDLPATALAESCYASMFKGCTSLVNAPELPSTDLVKSCYESMFENCTSLVDASDLPATALAEYCYASMFKGCTSLVNAPELLCDNIILESCDFMFSGCTSLNYVKCLANSIHMFGTVYWLAGVSSTGTFVKKAGVSWRTGAGGIPDNWTVIEVD